MFTRIRTMVAGPGPSEKHNLPSKPQGESETNTPGIASIVQENEGNNAAISKPALVYDLADESWVAGFIPGSETPRYPYGRPDILFLTTEDEIFVSGDQTIRPIMLPKDPMRMPLYAGYAECINAGKTKQNEDQATAKFLHIVAKRSAVEDCPASAVLPRRKLQATDSCDSDHSDSGAKMRHSDDSLLSAVSEETTEPDVAREDAVMFGIYDGHAGTGASLMAANCLHEHIREKLANVLDLIHQLDRQETLLGYTPATDRPENLPLSTQGGKKITRDILVVGALETAFAEMDQQIEEEKLFWKIPGGCAAIVALCFMQRVYIANAGDCRAVVYGASGMKQLSTDFTPDVERKRLQHVAFMYPHLAGRHYSRLEYSRHLLKRDVRKRVLFRDWYMEGWAQKTVKETDLRPSLISDGPRKPRLLNTIGVSRGFGDHHLVTAEHSIPIKPFLSAVPEVQILDLSDLDSMSDRDVLVLASDGLWDVLSNEDVGNVVNAALSQFEETDLTKYTTAAQDLVLAARGHMTETGAWKLVSETSSATSAVSTTASLDDISAFVIPLKHVLAPPMQDDDVDMIAF